MASFNQHTTGEEVAKVFRSRIEGKTFVVTGCSEGGIGASTAISLAHGSPATIFVAGRTLSKVNPAIEAIKAISPSTDAIFVPLDLGEFDSIRAAAKLVLESGKAEEIHGLINNAGVMAVLPYTKSKEGIELQFATNHVGHFLWTNLLLKQVIAAKGRIVNVSSGGFICGDVQLDNYNFDDGKTYHPWVAYGQSKTANVLFTTYLQSRLSHLGVQSFALQPGMPQTPLYRYTQDESSLASFAEAGRLLREKYGEGGDREAPGGGKVEDDLKSLEAAASTLIVAAVDERFDGKGGLFLRNCQEWWVPEYTRDPVKAEELWKLSEKLVGEKFDI